jgi:ATP-dependent DNA ligase
MIHRSIYQTNGKIRLLEPIEAKGKNAGKSNETTDVEQAQLEAQSLWEKKQNRELYSLQSDEGPKGVYIPTKSTEPTKVKPMLAKKFEDEQHKVKFPVFVQPKLDGIRVLLQQVDGKVVALSRKNTTYPFLSHIKEDAAQLFQHLPPNTILDGEIYGDGMLCQNIASIVATKLQPHDNESKLYYVVFDCIVAKAKKNDWYDVRYLLLQSAFRETRGITSLRLITNERANTKEELESWHRQFSQSYEGSIIRLPMFRYECKRSSSLLKWKTFQDGEFRIVDVVDGVGQDKGCATMVVETDKGQTFSARMTGTLHERQAYFQNRQHCIGKQLTVKYQELTADGIPRFPVGVCIRNYE